MLKAILDVGGDHKRVAVILFQYLFRGINKYEFREQIGDPELAKRVWSKVFTNGYVLRNCKLFAYAVHANRKAGLSTSPARYEIMQEDVGLLRGLDLSHIPHIYKPYSLFDYTNLENALIGSDELQTNIGKFVSKKLIFLDRHFGEKREEIEQALIEASIYALRKQFPFYMSHLHALNVCKTAARNKGHQLIEFHTRGKRNKLLKENGQFQAVNVPLESMLNLSVQPEHDNAFRIDLQALAALEPRMDPRVKSFVHAAAGHYDAGFTLYLGMDNEDAAMSMDYDRYMLSLREYLGVTEAQVQKLMGRLRSSMS